MREEAALASWEDEGGSTSTLVTERSPPASWFNRIFGAQHHLGMLGPAAAKPGVDPTDPDDGPLICRARD